MRCLQSLACAAAVSAALFSGSLLAQGAARPFPSRLVTVIVPYAAGGPIDIEARLYMPKMGELTGQPFILDFKAGAGGTIGATMVARAAPDGHTLLIAGGSFSVYPAIFKDLPFDVVKDFSAVSLMSEKPLVMVAYPMFPPKNFQEYIAYARANPGKVNFGTLGLGNLHLLGAWMHGTTNTRVTLVPYKGAAPMTLDLIGGQIDVTATALLAVLPQIKTGKLRALAMTGVTRSRLQPDVPTIAEQGMPGFGYTNWTGIVAPAATPATIVARLSEGFAKVVKSAEVSASLDTDGSLPVGSTPAQFRQLLVTETERWRKVALENGINPE